MKCKTLIATLAAFTLLSTTHVDASAATTLDEVKSYVNDYYYPGITPSTVKNSKTVKQLTDRLDDYSMYMTADEYASFYNAVESKLVGIGIGVSEHKQGIKILQVFDGSPAKKAGMKTNDIITKVNGQTTANMSLEKGTAQLKGKEGTTVKVTFYRPSTKKTYTKTLKRAVVNVPNVETAVLSGRIGYIYLNSFASNSGSEITAAIKKMPKDVKGYILDLRDNGGGDVAAAEDIIGLAKNNKYAYLLNTRSGNYYQVPTAQKTHWNAPLAILVNGNSASASEMTAAAYKDQQTATLYGEKTYGKGVMQGIYPIKDSGYLKLTVAEFIGPKGTVIQKKGVTPNVKTTSELALYKSHKAYLAKQLKKYDKEATIKRTTTNQTITLKSNKDMDWKTLKNAKVSLMQIGGKTKSVQVKVSGKSLVVQPKAKLAKGTSYYLRIVNAKNTKDGIYHYVTIK